MASGPDVSAVPPWPGEDDTCAECGFVFDDVDPSVVGELLSAVAEQARTIVAAHDGTALAAHPIAGTWSVTEYLCHLRDVYVATTIRLYRARTEDRPLLEPMFNDLRAERFRYNEREPRAVLEDLDFAVAGAHDELALVRDWDRTVMRRPGEERTCRWLARAALHEGRHHLTDVRRVIDSLPTLHP